MLGRTSQVDFFFILDFQNSFQDELFKDFGARAQVGNWSIVSNVFLITTYKDRNRFWDQPLEWDFSLCVDFYTNGGIHSGYLCLLALYLSGTPSLMTGTSPPSCLLLNNRLWQDSTEVEWALCNYGYLHRAQVRIPLKAERINKLIRVSRVKSISAAACHKRYGVLNPYATRCTTGHPSVHGYW